MCTIIFFEFIDVVFNDETNFFRALKKCISKSKVPIVMTAAERNEDIDELIGSLRWEGILIKEITLEWKLENQILWFIEAISFLELYVRDWIYHFIEQNDD